MEGVRRGGVDEKVAEKGTTRLSALTECFIAQGAHRGWTDHTQQANHRALRYLVRYLARLGVHDALQVRETHLAEWVAFLKTSARPRCGGTTGPRYSPYTIVNYITRARQFFGWLMTEGVVLQDPARELTTRGIPTDAVGRLRIPTEQEVRQLLAEAPRESLIQIRDWVLVELLYSSGLRVGEARRLDVYDLDLDERTVRVRQGKGRKDRVVPVGRVACEALAFWLDVARPQLVRERAEPALFLTIGGGRMGAHTVYPRIRILRRQMGLQRLRAHDFRHASALHMLRHGADVRHIQELLGHAQVRTVQIYTRLAPDDLKKAHRRAHPRERHRGTL